ncbi:uncharacterized protein LACBIDRAFT_307524 [Laccaria bicolor S238N-H82]|uniref:Predicted protein n=1 Tax=Laccaria bicolor (strain S238N-H82 / ATCC MYA-4686) TaxID=486041 RepID=B0DQC7_LACBS|nr:uncharacterized protein LACBIDRAFT_307524 [Laccaria bicolor S238N-H82]EDR03272.1 predicted protein [Laccaria bicolor S238N-H82]|eukprot:XP_001886068.1 predicted protein [Laccaria bicolor S238N-H82]
MYSGMIAGQQHQHRDTLSLCPDQVLIPQSNCDAPKMNILLLLDTSPSRSIRLQLATALKSRSIVHVAHNFSHNWPSLLGDIKALLMRSANINQVHAGCNAALEAIRAFRFRQKSKALTQIVTDIFPTLVGLASQIIQTVPSTVQEILTMLYLILKTYKTSIIVTVLYPPP